jgi:peptidyl-prolyl isomerase E (cyclophilin E)
MHLSELNGKVIKVSLAKPQNVTATSHRAGKIIALIWEGSWTYKYKKVWTEESWLQKYAKTEEDKDKQETKQSDEEDDENDESETQTYQPKAKGGKTRVYMDIQIGGSLAGRIEMEVKMVAIRKTILLLTCFIASWRHCTKNSRKL